MGLFLMAIFTLEEIDAQITAYKSALEACSYAQEYSIGARRFTKADLPEIRSTLEWLDSEKSKLTNNRPAGPSFTTGRVRR